MDELRQDIMTHLEALRAEDKHAVILSSVAQRCDSKDGQELVVAANPSRLAKGLAPQDDGCAGNDDGATAPSSPWSTAG